MSTPASPATRNAAGIATRIDAPMWFGISSLHDVGGVGAEHHQLAVRHVDDAHDAERDGEADRDQHQHRAEAEAEEQRLDRRSRARAPIDAIDGAAGGRARTSASGSTKLPSGDCLDERGQPVADVRSRARLRQRLRSPRGASADRRRRERPCARPVSISRLHAGVGFGADALAQQRDGRRRRASAACR